MKAIWSITFFLTLVGQLAFGQKKIPILFPPPILGISDPEFISACELPARKNELVYTRFIYSGVDEYWGLRSPDKKCNNINAYLEIPDSVELRPEYDKLFKDVHEHYWKTSLIVDLIGQFDDSNKNGYGHLGSNSSKFIVKWIIDIQKVELLR
jgi:hypothetical protein